ncbi:MAG TPA: hypothetical protein PK409_07725 [Thermosynergistes sp.]|nr:hypothetical protein [Thermosynergistes sp.]HPZ77111.1 hypothetical protein [Thermosynergistes sp.]HQE21803.1 hypothetical protein [Thermosynergistes sp.]
MREVVWFINGWIMPWERRVLLAMAQGLSAKGVTLRALGLKGTSKEWGNVSFANWHFLTGFNKLKWLLYEGKLWHLWGDPPRWWPFVRLRTRVIHTQVEVASRWAGMPTICAPNFGDAGEVQLLPAFDGRSLWNATGSLFRIEGNMPLVIVAEGPKLSQEIIEALCSWEGPLCFLGRTNPPPKSQRLPLDDSVYVLWRERGGFLLLPTPTPALSWLAAQASLLGVPTIAAPSFWLDEILGCEGYIMAGGSESPSCEQWQGAIERAVDVGGGVAGFARRHVEARFSSEVAANKLLELYLDGTGGER